MQEIKLQAQTRGGAGTKKVLSALRSESKIPGVVYGGANPPILLMLAEGELMEARKRGGANAVLRLTVGDSAETVIIKELQRHPVTDRVIHVDFQRISLTQKIEAKVPLHVEGQAPGVKLSGGILEHDLRTLTVKALPTNIPAHITVDVSQLEINGHILVRDLKVPADIEVLDSPDHVVVHVTTMKVEEAAPAAVVTAEGGAAPAEPESASTKGKKDEEGRLVKPAAQAAGAAGAPEKAGGGAKKEKEKEANK